MEKDSRLSRDGLAARHGPKQARVFDPRNSIVEMILDRDGRLQPSLSELHLTQFRLLPQQFPQRLKPARYCWSAARLKPCPFERQQLIWPPKKRYSSEVLLPPQRRAACSLNKHRSITTPMPASSARCAAWSSITPSCNQRNGIFSRMV